MKPLVALAGIALLAVPLSTSLAQEDSRGGACRADLKRLCPDAAEGRGARTCLREKRDELSEECREQLAAARDRRGRTGRPGMRRALQSCRDDMETHCGGIRPGEGRLGRCLQENADKLSEPCREALEGLGS